MKIPGIGPLSGTSSNLVFILKEVLVTSSASVALETISGLTLSSQNYSEAIDLLKNHYGNPQALINSYMEQFVN